MKTLILCVGKLRQAHWRMASAEYVKRLDRFGGVEVAELPDLAEPKNASQADILRLVQAECAPMLARIKPRDHVVALCVEGASLTSPQLAERMRVMEANGVARAVYVLGGSCGLSGEILARADETLSFSRMTFPHELARVMLLEQLYRVRKMMAGETYHK